MKKILASPDHVKRSLFKSAEGLALVAFAPVALAFSLVKLSLLSAVIGCLYIGFLIFKRSRGKIYVNDTGLLIEIPFKTQEILWSQLREVKLSGRHLDIYYSPDKVSEEPRKPRSAFLMKLSGNWLRITLSDEYDISLENIEQTIKTELQQRGFASSKE